MSVEVNPHLTHSYSVEQVVKSALEYELHNTLINPKYDNLREVLESYMKERVNEIKDRWK